MSGNDTDLERLFRLSLDLLCVASGDGYFLRVNPAFEQTLGYGEDELLSRSFLDLVHPDDRDKTVEAIQQLLAGEPVVDFRNRYRAKDGGYRWLQWRSAPVDEEGKVYAVARDITRERETQELIASQARELARSNADLEEFAYAASHDLQAPLRSISNLAAWIGEDLTDAPAAVLEHLEQLEAQTQRMRRLVDDLLAYSRAGAQAGEVSQVDTGALVRETVRLLDPPAGLQVIVAPEMPCLETSRAGLEQVFRNLIGNSIAHHDRPDGRITVAARRAGRIWEFTVADDGPGIPAEDRERIFQMFQTLKGASSHGTGLGLALVKKVVERQGGRVWVEPGLGRGAKIRFTWPNRREAP